MRSNLTRALLPAVLLALAAAGARPAAAQGRSSALVYNIYDDADSALQAFSSLLALEEAGSIQMDGYAVLYKDQDGRILILNSSAAMRRGRAAGGALVGGVIGALLGPVGAMAGAGVGAAAGGGYGRRAADIPERDVGFIKSSLEPGSAVVLAEMDQRFTPLAVSALRDASSGAPMAPPPVEQPMQGQCPPY
jgi:uncharacterized membrane protein